VFSDAFAALSAKSYVQKGLVAHWDGIENAGYGKAHDNAATSWTELTGNGPDITNPSGSTVVDDGLTVVRASGTTVDKANAKKILDAYCSGNYTAEVVFDKTKATPNSSKGYENKICVMLMFGRAYSWMGTFGDTQMGINPMTSGGEGDLNGGTYITAKTTLGRHSLSCSQAGSESIVRVDRDLIARKTVTVGTQDRAHGFGFNRAWYEDYGLDGIYHTIRIYDRALDETETAVNYAVDQVRYFGKSASEVTLPYGWRFAATGDGDVRLEKKLAVSAKEGIGGTVVLNGGTGAAVNNIWCEQGGSVAITAVATPADGYVFAGWMGVAGDRKYDNEIEITVDDNVYAVFRESNRTEKLTYTWKGSADGDWNDSLNWLDESSLKGVPQAGDSVVIPAGGSVTLANSSPRFDSMTVAGTLVMTNWTTCLSADSLTIASGGILTCGAAVASESDLSRVWIRCGDLTVAAGGKINVSGRGYRGGVKKTDGERGYGPGSGYLLGGEEEDDIVFIYDSGLIIASPSHGGSGACSLNVNRPKVKAAMPYDDPKMPVMPGSGGYSTKWGAGGAGGGAVLIDASGSVTVDGEISADGVNQTTNVRSQPGSGGSICIACLKFSGKGNISAEGGDGYSSTEVKHALPAGGGSIAIRYDASLQKASDVEGMKISAAAGVYNNIRAKGYIADYSDWRESGLGTLFFTDSKIVEQLLGNGLCGQIKGASSFEIEGDLNMSWGYVRFADEAQSVDIGGDLLLSGANVRLEIGGCVVTNRTQVLEVFGGWRTNKLKVGGDLKLEGTARLDIRAASTNDTEKYGAYVTVEGTMTIGTNCAVYAWSDRVAPSSPYFEVGSLNVETGGLFSAARLGGAGCIDRHTSSFNNAYYEIGSRIPVRGAGRNTSGGGHGGKGGTGTDTSSSWGRAYDDAHRPWLPGSGAAAINKYSIGGNGGGAVIVSAKNGVIRIDGTVSADGENGNWAADSNGLGGGGAGGTILLECKRFAVGETGCLSAKGGTTKPISTSAVGAGGGGRIAVWCGEPWSEKVKNFQISSSVEPFGAEHEQSFSFAGSVCVDGGVALGQYAKDANHGGDGTVYFHHIRKARKFSMILR
jgi:hypothetical protein